MTEGDTKRLAQMLGIHPVAVGKRAKALGIDLKPTNHCLYTVDILDGRTLIEKSEEWLKNTAAKISCWKPSRKRPAKPANTGIGF